MSDRNLQLLVKFAAFDKFTAPVRKMMEGSRATGTQVKDLHNNIKRLNEQSGRIDGFRKLSSQTAVVRANFLQAQERVRSLSQAIQAAERPNAALSRSFERARKEAGGLKTQLGEMQQRLQRNRDALGAAGVNTSQLAKHQRDLKTQLASANKALDEHKAKLDKAAQASKAMRGARASYEKGLAVRDKIAGAGVTAGVAGAATLAGVGKTVSAYAEAENAATKLKSTMTGADGQVEKGFTAINKLANELGDKLPGTTADFQRMMTMLKRQGISTESILGGTGKATAYTAVQMDMAFDKAAEFTAKMQDATRANEKEMVAMMDVMQRANNVGVDPDNMLQAFSKSSGALGVLRLKGLEATKTLAPMFAMFDQAAMDGSAAGNAFRKVIQKGMDVSEVNKNIGKLQKAGTLSSGFSLDFTDGKGSFGGLENFYKQLEKIKGLNDVQKTTVIKKIFGDDAEVSQVLSTMMDKGIDGYREMAAKMEAQASLQQRVDMQLGTLTNMWDAATGTFTNVLARLGESISPEIKQLVEWIGDFNAKLGEWAEKNPQLTSTIMKTITVVGLLLAGFGAFAGMLAAVMGPMLIVKLGLASMGIQGLGVIKSITAIGNALMWVARLALAHPVLALITALAIGAVYVWQNWDTLGPKFQALLDRIRAAFSVAWEYIKVQATAAAQWIMAQFNGLVSWFTALPGRMAQIGADMINGIITGISSRLDALKATVVGAASSAASWFRQKLDINSPSRVFALMGRQSLQGYEQGMLAQQGGTRGAMGELVDRLLNAFPIVRRLAAVGTAALPALASAMPQLDTRPPLMASAPAMAAQMAGAAAGGGIASAAAPITINIYGAPGQSEQQLAKLVAREFEKLQRQQAARARGRMADRD